MHTFNNNGNNIKCTELYSHNNTEFPLILLNFGILPSWLFSSFPDQFLFEATNFVKSHI